MVRDGDAKLSNECRCPAMFPGVVFEVPGSDLKDAVEALEVFRDLLVRRSNRCLFLNLRLHS